MRRSYWLLIGFSLMGMVGGILRLPPHFSLLDLLLILSVFGALPLVIAGIIGRRIAAATTALPRWLLIAMIAAGCVINLRSVRDFPNFSATDEAIIVSYADSVQRTGRIAPSLIPYDAPIVTGNLYAYAVASWMRLFPDDPFALRGFSMLGGLILLAVTYFVGRSLSDGSTGWTAAALLATNLLWMAVAHVGRQEIWLAVLVWGSVWLALAAQKRQSTLLALLSGLVATLSADVHPLGAYSAVALAAWWFCGWLQMPSRAQTSRRLLLAFIAGGLLGATYYAGVHVLPDPGRFFAALHDEAVSYGAEGWSPVLAMLARHLSYLLANPLELSLLVVSAFAGLRYGRRLGIFLGALLALYTFTVADPNPYYPIVWMTGLVILTALSLRRVAWQWRAPLLVAFAAAFVLNAALIEQHIQAGWNQRAVDAIEQVVARVPPNQTGMGETFLYLALRDARYIGFTYISFGAERLGISHWDFVSELMPDWIVTMRDEAGFTPEFAVLSVDVPHMRLQIPDAALAEAYALGDAVVTTVGTFEIWERRNP